MRILLALTALACLGAAATAQIERLTLAQMVAKTDGAVRGEIVGREVKRVAHPHPEGGWLYFTSLHVRGTSLADGSSVEVVVSHPGGMISGEEGVWNSEAPTESETSVGNQVVVFYKWSDDMGGGFASNALYASHGGIFGVFKTRKGSEMVQGRGDGYAVSANRLMTDLAAATRDLYGKKGK